MPRIKHRRPGPLIYLFTFPNGKHYVGQTIESFEVRMNKHKSNAKNREQFGCRALNSAIVKYGWDNIKREILIFCDTDKLDYFESKFIHLYDTIAPNGYNLVSGGNLNKTSSNDTKNKTRLTMLRNGIASGKKKLKFGCCIQFLQKPRLKRFAIVDHPMCEFAIFEEEHLMLEYMQDMTILGDKQGIDCSEHNYFTTDESSQINTYFDVKFTLTSIVNQIVKNDLIANKYNYK